MFCSVTILSTSPQVDLLPDRHSPPPPPLPLTYHPHPQFEELPLLLRHPRYSSSLRHRPCPLLVPLPLLLYYPHGFFIQTLQIACRTSPFDPSSTGSRVHHIAMTLQRTTPYPTSEVGAV